MLHCVDGLPNILDPTKLWVDQPVPVTPNPIRVDSEKQLLVDDWRLPADGWPPENITPRPKIPGQACLGARVRVGKNRRPAVWDRDV